MRRLLRRLFTVLSALSLVLCVATIVAWDRTHRRGQFPTDAFIVPVGGRDGVVCFAVLEAELHVPAQEAAFGVDVADDHPRHVRVGEPHERERTRLVRDDAYPDRPS